MTAPGAWAGEHAPLCGKTHAAHLVLEIEFVPSGDYTKAQMEKGWGPSERALKKTRATGQVRRVFKGNIEPGAPVSQAWPIEFAPGNPRLPMWKAFFERKRFRQVVFLRKRGQKTWTRMAGAEESAGCESSAHRSWCPGYEDYLVRVTACLEHSVSPQALEKVCAGDCTGPLSSVQVFRDAGGQVKRLRHRGDGAVCSHAPDIYFDETGAHVFTVAQRPVGPEEAAILRAERARALAGLTQAELLSCPTRRTPAP